MRSISGSILILCSTIMFVTKSILSVIDKTTYNFRPIYKSNLFNNITLGLFILGIIIVLVDLYPVICNILKTIKTSTNNEL